MQQLLLAVGVTVGIVWAMARTQRYLRDRRDQRRAAAELQDGDPTYDIPDDLVDLDAGTANTTTEPTWSNTVWANTTDVNNTARRL